MAGGAVEQQSGIKTGGRQRTGGIAGLADRRVVQRVAGEIKRDTGPHEVTGPSKCSVALGACPGASRSHRCRGRSSSLRNQTRSAVRRPVRRRSRCRPRSAGVARTAAAADRVAVRWYRASGTAGTGLIPASLVPIGQLRRARQVGDAGPLWALAKVLEIQRITDIGRVDMQPEVIRKSVVCVRCTKERSLLSSPHWPPGRRTAGSAR